MADREEQAPAPDEAVGAPGAGPVGAAALPEGATPPPPAQPVPADPPGRSPADYHESSLWRWRGTSSLVVGLLFAVLGLLFVAGAQAFRGGDVLDNARPADLVQILDSLEQENDRLRQEQLRLQAELGVLTSGTSEQALAAAERRLEALEVLAGTEPVRGPGIRMVIRDPQGVLGANDLLDAVQELRDAGAESIEVAQQRVVVDTWFSDPPEGESGVLISGELRGSPYTVLAIGDPQTLATAMEIPGGVADSVRTAGAQFELDRRDELDITATVPLGTPDYAEPAGR
ncbi:MAG: DUF881 domain-containing protein [Candidatus Nanopelagicales bacterium]|jgi:uncharacterized protein YlxW (UPF0749 family)|nr:DUF881 domain-containing protein [Candidatus Nanopelagicales bacterium]